MLNYRHPGHGAWVGGLRPAAPDSTSGAIAGDPGRSPDEFQIAHFMCVLSVKTDLDPPLDPLNPPKARHSSGRPWESLWEGPEELWESFGRLGGSSGRLWRSSLGTKVNEHRLSSYVNITSAGAVDREFSIYRAFQSSPGALPDPPQAPPGPPRASSGLDLGQGVF